MKVVDLGINGEGIAKEEGKVYFIKGALIDEEVTIKNEFDKNSFTNCEVDKILQKSNDREHPKCPYFMTCGGCQLQHLKYNKQLEYKSKLVRETLKKVGNIEAVVEECIPSNKEYEYRNKNAFPCFVEGGHSQLGMFIENSKKIVKIEECCIADSEINRVLKVTNDFLRDKLINGLRYLVIRNVKGRLIITLVSEKKEIPYLKKYLQILLMHFKNFNLNININNNRNTILSNEFVNVYGDEFIEVESFGIKYKVNAGSFMQVNDDVKEKLYNNILGFFNKDDIVIDAYCGAGLLSAMIANKVKYCYGVEISQDAIISANELQRSNSIKNLFFIHGDCDKEIPSLLENIEDVFSLILDPPRKGCSDNVLKGVLVTRPEKIIYVSCNPITLAKDLKVLINGGYKLRIVRPFDMFPQTTNVETLVLLEK